MKVLIVYGSERGGTAGLAQMVGEEFRRLHWDAEVRNAADAGPAVDDADAVVVGGALYMGRWHREARRFVQRNEATLAQMPVWLFSSGPLDNSARPGALAPVPGVQALARRIEARGHMTFGGRLEPDAKGLVARLMARKMAGDWRDPEHVREWVHQIVHDFLPAEIVVPAARSMAEPETPVRAVPATAAVATQVRIPKQRSRKRSPVETG